LRRLANPGTPTESTNILMGDSFCHPWGRFVQNWGNRGAIRAHMLWGSLEQKNSVWLSSEKGDYHNKISRNWMRIRSRSPFRKPCKYRYLLVIRTRHLSEHTAKDYVNYPDPPGAGELLLCTDAHPPTMRRQSKITQIRNAFSIMCFAAMLMPDVLLGEISFLLLAL